MKEKIKRILDLVRAGKLDLNDAAPLLAALSARLALTDADRELVASLLAREELDTAQVAEHLMLLRGVRDTPPAPPRPPAPEWPWTEQATFSREGSRPGRGHGPQVEVNIDGLLSNVHSALGRMGEAIGAAGGGPGSASRSAAPARILRVQVESSEGDEYDANLPLSLAPHLHKLIPPHGLRALERSGLSIEALQLLIEAAPPPGNLLNAEDSEGNRVKLTLS